VWPRPHRRQGSAPSSSEPVTYDEQFRHFRHAIAALNDATADKPQKMFNRQTTVRGSLEIAITREHLGQSIA